MTDMSRVWQSGKRSERGLVLVLAVFAVTLILVLAVGLSTAVRAELLASRTSLERAQSLFLAEAGISQARALLLYEDPNVDTLQDPWGLDAEEPLDHPQPVGEGGYYRVRVEDACGRIDINTADFATLAQLTGDPAVATAIIDWRTQGSLEGYYRALPYPYLPRRGAFQSPGELLLVQGVTPELYFGTKDQSGLVNLVTVVSESANTNAQGRDRLGLQTFSSAGEEAFRKWVAEQLGNALTMYEIEEIWRGYAQLHDSGQGGYTSLAQLATVAGLSYDKVIKVVDYLTVDRDPQGSTATRVRGKVNVNTASAEVLAAMPGCSAGLAEEIVKHREKQPFLSLNEVAELLYSGGGGQHTFELMIDHVTTKSSCFIIDSMGYTEAGRGYRTLRALVHRNTPRQPDQFTLYHQVIVLRQTEEDAPLPPFLTQADSGERARRFRLAAS